MKNNLENAFKESLKDYKVPYNPKAWEAVSAQLDARAAAGAGSSSILKWAVACLLTGALVVGVYYLNQNNKNTQTASNLANTELNNNRVDGNKDNHSAETTVNEDVNSQEVEGNTEVDVKAAKETLTLIPNGKIAAPETQGSKLTDEGNKSDVNHNPGGTTSDGDLGDNNNGLVPSKADPKSSQFIEGRVSMLNICEGENVVISNPDKDKSLVKFQIEDGQMIVLDPGKSYVFKPMSTTKISFVNKENELIATKQIQVHNLPSVNFTYEANVFEKGLPLVVCEAYGEYASYTWTYDEKIEKSGAKSLYNFFKKGDHDIALKVIDRNGCENTMTKKVNIRSNYNLMAVDAFRPNGSEPKNRTFMPYSLTERDAKFQLTIIDPTDNGIVYTSKDAKNTWDGTDQRTGEMTNSNKTFIWKVQIYNPVPNERPIYSGTIVHD